MSRARALVLALAIGVVAVTGVFAATRSAGLSSQSHRQSDALVAQRTRQLNRYDASLRRALERMPPALPTLPKAASRQASSPVRVAYHRPPPIIVHTARVGGEHEYEAEGGEADD